MRRLVLNARRSNKEIDVRGQSPQQKEILASGISCFRLYSPAGRFACSFALPNYFGERRAFSTHSPEPQAKELGGRLAHHINLLI